jgi:hypothetical protein
MFGGGQEFDDLDLLLVCVLAVLVRVMGVQ